jgi:sugar/nucleoside kinase (ribokinase family)
MAKAFIVSVIGDVHIELHSQLDGYTFADIDRDTLLYQAITSSVSGTAASFALAALDYYQELHILGKIGADIFGSMAVNQLTAAGVHVHCAIDHTAPTALAVNLRDANPAHAKGTRLLIVQSHTANHLLNVADIEQYAHILMQSDLLVLDGYCLLTQPRHDASLKAMHIARAHNVLVAFDIVPHNAFKLYNFDTLKSIVELSDIIITELNTIQHFLQMDRPHQTYHREEMERAIEVAAILQLLFQHKTFILRFGIGNCDQSLISLPGQVPQHHFTGYSQAEDLRGFGDRLTAQELAEILPLFNR